MDKIWIVVGDLKEIIILIKGQEVKEMETILEWEVVIPVWVVVIPVWEVTQEWEVDLIWMEVGLFKEVVKDRELVVDLMQAVIDLLVEILTQALITHPMEILCLKNEIYSYKNYLHFI